MADTFNGAAQVLHAKAAKTQGRSLQSFLASLVLAAIIFLVELLLFFIFRRTWPEI